VFWIPLDDPGLRGGSGIIGKCPLISAALSESRCWLRKAAWFRSMPIDSWRIAHVRGWQNEDQLRLLPAIGSKQGWVDGLSRRGKVIKGVSLGKWGCRSGLRPNIYPRLPQCRSRDPTYSSLSIFEYETCVWRLLLSRALSIVQVDKAESSWDRWNPPVPKSTSLGCTWTSSCNTSSPWKHGLRKILPNYFFARQLIHTFHRRGYCYLDIV